MYPNEIKKLDGWKLWQSRTEEESLWIQAAGWTILSHCKQFSHNNPRRMDGDGHPKLVGVQRNFTHDMEHPENTSGET